MAAASEVVVESWRGGEHDDLVLAVTSATWGAEQARSFSVVFSRR